MAGRVPRKDREGGATTLSSSACAIFALWIEQVAGMRRWWCQRWQDWQRLVAAMVDMQQVVYCTQAVRQGGRKGAVQVGR